MVAGDGQRLTMRFKLTLLLRARRPDDGLGYKLVPRSSRGCERRGQALFWLGEGPSQTLETGVDDLVRRREGEPSPAHAARAKPLTRRDDEPVLLEQPRRCHVVREPDPHVEGARARRRKVTNSGEDPIAAALVQLHALAHGVLRAGESRDPRLLHRGE